MPQEQLADATGLTPVHVNRMLMRLDADGPISRHNRHVTVANWQALAEAGDFSELFLRAGGG